MNKLIYIICFILSTNLVAQDMVLLKKGAEAPFDGTLVTQEKMAKFRKINEEKKLLERKNVALEDLRVVNVGRVEHYKKTAENARKELRNEQIKGFFKSTLYFIGGVVLTGAISYGLQKTVGK